MVNSVQKRLGYRDVIYNVKTEKFVTGAPGDNYRDLEVKAGVESGGTDDRPTSPETGDLFWDIDKNALYAWDGSKWIPVGSGSEDGATVPEGPTANRPGSPQTGDLYWDTDLNQLVIYDGANWVPVGGGTSVVVESGDTAGRPDPAEEGELYYDTSIDTLLVYSGGSWGPVAPEDIAVLEEIVLQDKVTDAEVVLSVRDGALVVTDPFKESVQVIDLGGTTPDPGNMRNVFINGAGRYAVGQNTLLNTNGLITLEYINSPGQFFVIDDISAGGFGPGDRQGFGLVAEDIVDGTNLRGGPAPLTTGNSGGWSFQYTWYYTGGYPYGWTSYFSNNQTPGGTGGGATGAYSSQTAQRQWWDLCGRAGVGRRLRTGIANGTLTQQDGADFTNRLVIQLYVYQEMIDHPDAATLLPAVVRNNGAGWYTQSASGGEYENLGQFPDGNDKGYRFRWSTFGNTVLGQLPYVTGVSDNDQITSASGLSHYVVYNADAADVTAANAVEASGLIGPNNRLYPESTTVHVLQFNQPYDWASATTDEADVFELKYTYLGPVLASPLFVSYPVSTTEEIIDAGVSVAPLEKLHANVCEEVRQAVTAYYLVRDFDAADTLLINTKLAEAVQAALSGQLITTYDAVDAVAADDDIPEGTNGDVLFPQALKDAILQKLSLWMATLPDN